MGGMSEGKKMAPAFGTTAWAVIKFVRQAGVRGATADEIEVGTGFPHQTVSPTVSNLKKAGVLVDSGSRRATRCGAIVPAWTIAKESA